MIVHVFVQRATSILIFLLCLVTKLFMFPNSRSPLSFHRKGEYCFLSRNYTSLPRGFLQWIKFPAPSLLPLCNSLPLYLTCFNPSLPSQNLFPFHFLLQLLLYVTQEVVFSFNIAEDKNPLILVF